MIPFQLEDHHGSSIRNVFGENNGIRQVQVKNETVLHFGSDREETNILKYIYISSYYATTYCFLLECTDVTFKIFCDSEEPFTSESSCII